MPDRRSVLMALGGAAASALAGCTAVPDTDPDALARRAASLLDAVPAVDLHAHPGRFFLRGGEPLHLSLAPLNFEFAERSVTDMKAGRLSAVCFSIVGDLISLRAERGGSLGAARHAEPGALYASYRRQLAAYRMLAEAGLIFPVLEPAHVDIAREQKRIGAILTCEGGDFLEGRIERLEEAYRDGVRSLAIVHYRLAEIGDIQTEQPAHGGLTSFGETVVRRMNELGMIVDVAHASKATLRRTCEISADPVLLSHSNLERADNLNPRLIDAQHARLVADTGGVIGAWPAGIGIADFDGWIDEILRLIDVVGVSHVGIGTDMDANFRPVFTSFADFPRIPQALLARGLQRREVGQIVGGNFMRLFRAVAK